MAGAGGMDADGFVGDVAATAFDAIVNADLADGAESFVVERGYAQGGPQLFVKLAQVFQVRCQSGDFCSLIGQQKLLVAGVPQARELTLEHDGGQDGELQLAIRGLPEFRAASVFFHADDPAGAADGEAEGGQTFNGFGREMLFDIPHRGLKSTMKVAAV